MITLVGIGHVFSIREAVKYIIYQRRPHAVCVELDRFRFEALEQGLDRSEDAPFLLKRLQKVYDRAAQSQGADVGEEMLGAVEAAQEMNIPHFFIDVEATPMVNNILSDIPLMQRLKLFGSVIGASFLPKKQIEKGIEQVENDPDLAMEQFGRVFPQLKERIVDYRDTYMSRRIRALNRDFPHLLAVVGEGHIKGISSHLDHGDLDVIHLGDVKKIADGIRTKRIRYVPPDEIKGNSSVSFTMELEISP
ncbi:MAG TPA: hypothetical protein ENK47_02040 [Euryarchaeota archaeon]|nr:hypothetical protein [Euryarchaeota archaeon]